MSVCESWSSKMSEGCTRLAAPLRVKHSHAVIAPTGDDGIVRTTVEAFDLVVLDRANMSDR
jgi:hypothetical protein